MSFMKKLGEDIVKSTKKHSITDALEKGAAQKVSIDSRLLDYPAIDPLECLEGTLNPNHRHDDPDEKAVDQIRENLAASHRFRSFAPVRPKNVAKWFIDGHDYFYAVSELIDSAQENIFILDWWLSPELYLRRPPSDFPEWRLDRLLKRKAEQGVKIYVIVYKEVTQTMNTSSRHSKNALSELHPNVSVLRHPDHIGAEDSVQFWSHHEKVLVVDNHRACIGGLDMCFGRWDTHNQYVVENFAPKTAIRQDYNNGRVLDFQQVDNYVSNQVSILETSRMPWHDVHMSIVGDAVMDIVQHFTERWNEVKKRKYRHDPTYDWLALPKFVESMYTPDLLNLALHRPHHEGLTAKAEKFKNRWHDVEDRVDASGAEARHARHARDEAERGFDIPDPHAMPTGTCNVQVVRSICDWSHGQLIEHSIQNAYLQLINEANHFIYIENQFFISNATLKNGPIKNTIANALVERILYAARSGRKFKVIVVIPEVPGFSGDIQQENGIKVIMAAQWRTINRGGGSIYEQIRAAGFDPLDYIRFYHLRAYDRINAPLGFISQMEINTGVTFHEAQIAQARMWIGDDGFWHQDTVKIKRPSEFAGVDDNNLGMTEKKTVEEVESVNFPKSTALAQGIVQRFESGAPRSDVMVSDTISQHLLQDETQLQDEAWMGSEQEERNCFVTELVYIHTKLMIVDDRRVIMGSANLNDRSQKGDGDSEIAMVVDDTDMIESMMDGNRFLASRFAGTLRRKLFREHLGLIPPQNCVTGEEPVTSFMHAPPIPAEDETHLQEDQLVADPLSDDFERLWHGTARINTAIFSEIFRTVPNDSVRNWDQYKMFLPNVRTGHVANAELSLPEIKEKLSKVKGTLVEAPLNFLIEQKELVENRDWQGLNPSLPIFV
ncbi:hypothetical protein FRB96_009577 [Tulasnella sp. 330]|nr:hypothetical protein FRB96_009577 [Tulasnella sp. 330]